jgi:hypothetical protein
MENLLTDFTSVFLRDILVELFFAGNPGISDWLDPWTSLLFLDDHHEMMQNRGRPNAPSLIPRGRHITEVIAGLSA